MNPIIKRQPVITLILALIAGLACLAFATQTVSAETTADEAICDSTVGVQDNQEQPSTDQTATEPTQPPAPPEGWQISGGVKYYYQNGVPLKGRHRIDSIWYDFNQNTGALTRTIGDDMDMKAQSYKSKKKMLILVSYSKHRFRVYKGKKNKWKRIKDWKCTMGARSTPTPRGTYTVKGKGKYFNTEHGYRCWYWTQFKGNYLIHSIVYHKSSRPSRAADSRLGINASHGCIRLATKNAKWVNRKVPRGTKVVIY